MPIPRILHQTGKTKAISKELEVYRDQLLKLHPHWDYRFYDDAGCRSIVERCFPSFIPVYESYPSPIQRADSFRVIAVYGLGGFYLDLDMVCFRPLDDLCAYHCVFGEEKTLAADEAKRLGHRHAVRVANYMFGSEAGHPFLLHILEMMVRASRRMVKREEEVLETTGPGLVTRAFFSQQERMRDVVLLPNRDRICPSPHCRTVSCHFGDYAAHRHAGSWRWQARDGGRRPAPSGRLSPSREQIRAICSELRSVRREVSLPETICILGTHNDEDGDGLAKVFDLVSPVGKTEKDTKKLANRKVLVCGPPCLFTDRISHRNINVVYTTFESTELPGSWVSAINEYYDYCLVPHGHIKSVFEKSGVQVPITVIDQGFGRYGRSRRDMGVERGFRVGFLGVPVGRKNLIELHHACSDLAGKIRGVKLVAHVFHSSHTTDECEIAVIRSSPFVEWSEGRLSDDELGKWYRNLSCLVLPASGEGWSFAPRESLYLGVPTVLTDIPVHDELIASGHCKVIPANGFEDAKFESGIFGKWRRVEVEDIRAAILDVYRRYGHYQIEALKGSRWIESRWSNERLQQSILEFFSSIS